MARAHTPAKKQRNALRSGNAGVTAAMKLSQPRCSDSWQPQDLSRYFRLSLQFSFIGSGVSSYAAPWRGFPLDQVGWLPSHRGPPR